MSGRAPSRSLRPGAASTAVSACALQVHRASLLRLDPAATRDRRGPSLAQRLGVAPVPPAPLSPLQWLERQQASQRRQDSAGACPICLRAFKAEEQVLLSCSHTFHAACLAAFERFSRQTAGASQRCCPLCRCASYEKKKIDDAALLWRNTCATRIQAAWRGVLGRRQARALRRLLPPRHPAVLRRWAAEELGECSKGLVISVDKGAADIEALFAELDATSRACNIVYAALAIRCPGIRAAAAADAPVEAAEGGSDSSHRAHHPGSSSYSSVRTEADHQPVHAVARQGLPAGPDWEAAIDRFLQREAPECPICLSSLALQAPKQSCGASARTAADEGSAPPTLSAIRRRGRGSISLPKSAASSSSSTSSTSSSTSTNTSARGRYASDKGGTSDSNSTGDGSGGVAVLSCSHAFHSDCLSAFEAFALASDLAPACPCCRATYQRMDLR